MNLPKLKTKKIKIFLEKIPRVLAERAFLTFLGLFLASLVLSGTLFYKYNISVKKADLKITDQPVEFNEEVHNRVLQVWRERETEFAEIDSLNYSDPFK